MNNIEFVKQLKALAVDGYVSTFRDALIKGVDEKSEAPIVQLFSTLSPEQRGALLQSIHQVCIDSVFQVLGVIDGTSADPGAAQGLTLTLPSGERLDGDLQKKFLSLFERE